MYNNLKFTEPFIIAEIGGNHEGDFEYAKKLLINASEAGANAVKFQTYYPDKIVSKVVNKERHEHFAKFALPIEKYIELAELAHKNNIMFMSSIWDKDSLKILDPYIGIHKIGSGDLTNYPLIEEILKTNKPFIFSVAMANLEEIKETVEFINNKNPSYLKEGKLAILQCVAMYGDPKHEFANLNVIRELQTQFPKVNIGYSDHTIGNYAANIAVALGANILELHFTDDKSRDFRDHHLSVTKDELLELRNNISLTSALLGSSEKKPVKDIESPERIWEFRRACYLNQNCKKGDILTEENLTTLRPCEGIDARNFYQLLGKALLVDKPAFYPLSWDDIG